VRVVRSRELPYEVESFTNELLLMPALVDFIVVRKLLRIRMIQQSVYISDIGAFLGMIVGTGRVAVVPPALCLHDQQVEQGHDGDAVDIDNVVRTDFGKPESRWDEDVDLDLSSLCHPSREATVEYLMSRSAFPRRLEVITIVLLYDPFLYVLRSEAETFCANDDVNVLYKRDISWVSVWGKTRKKTG
jgi:hypothetical protein